MLYLLLSPLSAAAAAAAAVGSITVLVGLHHLTAADPALLLGLSPQQI